jgi:prolyl-tRNA synthetase
MSRWSQSLIPTLKEVPAEAQVVSHITMLRGGYMRKLAAGIYSFLPLGWRVMKKVEAIVREELDRAGAQEILMPAAVPAELWMESGRWQKYGPELLRWKDRKGADFCTGPTHEEVVVDIVRREVKSYRQLPVNLYQIQTKFRDEARPRAGLMRGREFIMKDAYSFHAGDEDARREYRAMYDAYTRIFKRCGLEFRAVEADTGAIGGSLSHEFQVLAQSGEDRIVSCNHCDYAANVEQAEVRRESGAEHAEAALREVATPGKKTIEEVTDFLKVPAARLIKTVVFLADKKTVMALVRGDHEVNEVKLKKKLGADELFLIAELPGAPAGFYGPIGRSERIVADIDVGELRDAVAGANKVDTHLVGVSARRDLPDHVEWADIRQAVEGDTCPRCGVGKFVRFQGIEVGHVFFLGTKYSQPMECTYLGEDGQLRPMTMGCYGIGITRTAAAAIEQNHDADGIIWPMSLSPYQVEILTLQAKDEAVVMAAEKLYGELVAAGIEVLYDDRDERPGVKFKDADLIGIPLRVAVGKKSLAEGKLELKARRAKQPELIPVGDAASIVRGRVRAELEKLLP